MFEYVAVVSTQQGLIPGQRAFLCGACVLFSAGSLASTHSPKTCTSGCKRGCLATDTQSVISGININLAQFYTLGL